MAPNPTVVFNEVPKGEPNDNTLKVVQNEIDLDAPLEGGFLVKVLCFSLDPYMRGRMRDPSIKSYVPAFELNKPLVNFGVGKIVKSESSKYKEGDHVYGYMPFQAYTKANDNMGLRILDKKYNIPWTVYVGVGGMPGKTAYMGFNELAEVKKGDTVFVSAGSGPVGQMVIQIAKQAGCKVITSAGSDEKVAYCKELGADVAFNYKTEDANEILAREGPISANWVNVGGKAFDDELKYMADYGRCIFCGWISGYNGAEYGVKNLMQVVAKRLKFRGFIVSDFHDKYEEQFYQEVIPKIASGEFKLKEHIYEGLESTGKAFQEMLSGKGFGKVVVKVADE